MLTLSQSDIRPDASWLATPGAFAWWYLDLLDANGNGLVLVWALGLPFAPGDDDGPPAQRPWLNAAVYEEGREAFYLLQRFDPADVSWGDGWWRFGRSHIEAGGGRVDVALDCEVPGSKERLVGRIEGCGRPVVLDAPGTGDHIWAPRLTACPGTAALAVGTRTWTFDGRLYHDANLGSRPLHTHGIEHWWWCRASLPDRELVLYHLEPEGGGEPKGLALEIWPDGSSRELTASAPTLAVWRRTRFGPAMPATVVLEVASLGAVEISVHALVDDSPYYQRQVVRLNCELGQGWGMAERAWPGRLALGPVWSWLARMRVHDLRGNNSLWLPLFSGPDRGRWKRLLASEPA